MPVVNNRVRAYSDAHKLWISSGVIKSIIRKSSLYKNYLKKKTPQALEKYKTRKNMLTNLIRTSERLYYQDKFNSAMGDIKKTWHVQTLSIPTTAPSRVSKKIKLITN